ncbi:MAG: RidA family protein [Bacteroidetes bacterium]|nr:RidA family protein [Bacteroidota bacterium]
MTTLDMTTEAPLHAEQVSDSRLSTPSKRQREGRKHTGAFGARTGHSDLIFIEGILPEQEGTIASDLSIEEQTALCLDRLDAALQARSAVRTNVMKIEVQLTDMADQSAVDAVYRNRLGDEYPPRTTVGVCALPGGASIQLDVIAADE